jgi:hypothetical protein
MNTADILILLLLGAADICLMVHLRRRRARHLRMARMNRCLELHIRTEVETGAVVVPYRRRSREHVS